MRYALPMKGKAGSSALARFPRSPARRSALIVAVLTSAALLTVAVRAYNHATLSRVSPAKPSVAVWPARGDISPQNGRLYTKLSLQPEADRFRRRLGQRFLAPGRERATLVGILTLGAQQLPVRIIRSQNDNGEQVEIALGLGPASLTWNAVEGAKSGVNLASGVERLLLERLALDSPDQLILAQLRGAAYYTVARAARPAGVGASDTYNGPVWDVVQISEPIHSNAVAPLSGWRLYQINVATGLIDRVVSQEQQGQDLTAEITSWITQGGETLPSHITWKQGAQTVMDLTLSGAIFAQIQ